jgi:predicted nucleic acid-binding protein
MLMDTSGLLCYFDEGEVRYRDAVAFFDAAAYKLTHSYVLAEFVPLCLVRGMNRLKTPTFLSDLTDNPLIEMVWVDETLHRAAQAYLERRPDKRYSLCDATSFLLMQEYGITEALTTDHHFEQARFQRLLR